MLGQAVGKNTIAESCGEDAGVSSEKSTACIEFNIVFAASKQVSEVRRFLCSNFQWIFLAWLLNLAIRNHFFICNLPSTVCFVATLL